MYLRAFRSTINAYISGTLNTADLKASLSVSIDAKSQPSDQESLEILKEYIQVEIIYYCEIFSRPSLLFQVIRDYLVLKGVLYIRHASINKLSYGVDNKFLDEEDKVYTFDKLKYHPHGSKNVNKNLKKSVNSHNQSFRQKQLI